MNHELYAFIEQVKKNHGKGLKGLSIKPINWETFQASVKKTGHLNLSNIVSLYEWSKSILSASAQQLDFIIYYHKDSPRYWLKNIDKPEDRETDNGKIEKVYSVGLDLEDFLESQYKKKQKDKIKALGSFIPDNYELAKRVMKDFNKTYKKKHSIWDNSFRETALWESNNLEEIKALASFLEKKYVIPDLKVVLKRNNIREVIFTKKQVEFKYK